jgi:hypothetical protein
VIGCVEGCGSEVQSHNERCPTQIENVGSGGGLEPMDEESPLELFYKTRDTVSRGRDK